MNDSLPELRDIHLPDGVSIFPPAYGWYILILAAIVCFLLIKLYYLLRRKNRKHYALKMLSELNRQDIIFSVTQISELLRRICVYRYPQAVALSGQRWLDFIQQHGHEKLSEQNKILLLNAPYMKNDSQKYNIQNLDDIITFARSWVGENL